MSHQVHFIYTVPVTSPGPETGGLKRRLTKTKTTLFKVEYKNIVRKETIRDTAGKHQGRK